jgi:hypothetical protein
MRPCLKRISPIQGERFELPAPRFFASGVNVLLWSIAGVRLLKLINPETLDNKTKIAPSY